MKHVKGYTLALDMTARNIQAEAKAKGMPWTISKGADTYCPIDSQNLFTPEQIPNPHNLDLWLKVNGELRQSGSTKDMIHSVPRLISFISTIMTLEENDVILTGTPSGIAAVKHGDIITCGITNYTTLTFRCVNRNTKSSL
mgnify:CR=1 FL=1